MNVSERFWPKVRKTDGCWIWTRARNRGYGVFRFNGKNGYAHRWAYANAYGPIPAGLTIDHSCHNQDPSCSAGSECPHRACVRPDHLEAVSLGVNTMRSPNTLPGANVRKETCPLGHPLTPRGQARRQCAECRRRQNRERKMRKRREAGIPVGRGIHQKMRTHCPRGHEYSTENTRVRKDGSRVCRVCDRSRTRETN